jgi:hypothetical protein
MCRSGDSLHILHRCGRAATQSVARATFDHGFQQPLTANAIQFAALLAPSLFIACARCDALSLKIVASPP